MYSWICFALSGIYDGYNVRCLVPTGIRCNPLIYLCSPMIERNGNITDNNTEQPCLYCKYGFVRGFEMHQTNERFNKYFIKDASDDLLI